MKLEHSDDIILDDLLNSLQEEENMEGAFFLSRYIPKELTFKLQFGKSLNEILKDIDFEFPLIQTLLLSLSNTKKKNAIKDINITSNLIKNRKKALKEKENTLAIYQKRISLIRYVTTLTIAIIAGFSPLFSFLYSILNYQIQEFQISLINYFSLSYLMFNVLNNYFLLKLTNKNKIKVQLIIISFIHLIIIVAISTFLSQFFK